MFASTLKMMLLLYDSKLTEIYSLVTSTAATAAGADPFAEEGRGGLSAKTTPSGVSTASIELFPSYQLIDLMT